jgi:molecular chaperone GrpE
MSENEKNAPTANGSAQATGPKPERTGDDLQSCIDRLQRLQAEFENYKKRTVRDNGVLEDRIADQVIADFLVPYENIERALRSCTENGNVDAFVAGVEQVFSQFAQLLEQRGVERIPSVGEPFDPALHEAVLSIPSEMPKYTVIEEFSSGYRRDGRILRASRVSVSRGPAAEEEQA